MNRITADCCNLFKVQQLRFIFPLPNAPPSIPIPLSSQSGVCFLKSFHCDSGRVKISFSSLAFCAPPPPFHRTVRSTPQEVNKKKLRNFSCPLCGGEILGAVSECFIFIFYNPMYTLVKRSRRRCQFWLKLNLNFKSYKIRLISAFSNLWRVLSRNKLLLTL